MCLYRFSVSLGCSNDPESSAANSSIATDRPRHAGEDSSYRSGLVGPDAYPPGPKLKKGGAKCTPNFGPILGSVARAVQFF
jgi:hypothetical protein